MGKWDRVTNDSMGDGPPVRTLFDRRKHDRLLPDGDAATNRIVVQPAQTSRRVNDNLVLHYTCTSGGSVTPVKPPRKFLPAFPEVREGSFVRKWLEQSNSLNVDSHEDLKMNAPDSDVDVNSAPPSPGPGNMRRTKSGEQSGRLTASSSDSDSAAVSPRMRMSEVPQLLEIVESTPVLPFRIDPEPERPLPIAAASSSDTSTTSTDTATSGTSISTDMDEERLIKYHKSVMRLFDVGDRRMLNCAGMNIGGKIVDDFYFIKKSNRGFPLKCSFDAILKNLKSFAKTPVAIGAVLHCHVTRNKVGVDRSLYPTYFLYLEEGSSRQNRILLLTARKRKKSTTSNYLISTDPAQVGRRNNAFVGKVRGNLIGTEFTIYDSGNSPKRFNYTALATDLFNYRQELGTVIYEPNVFGFKGPRRMKLVIPSMLGESERFECRPDVEEETIQAMTKKQILPPTLVELRNNRPQWSAETQSYVLNFMGRVTQPSVKNFQIIHPEKPEYIVLQFGRIEDDNFTLDFRYPLCPLQAFGIALTSFDSKIACE